MLYMRNCLVCNTPFAARTANHRLHSQRCRLLYYLNRPINVTLELHNAEIPSDLQPFAVRVRSSDRIRCEEGSPASMGSVGPERPENTSGGGTAPA